MDEACDAATDVYSISLTLDSEAEADEFFALMKRRQHYSESVERTQRYIHSHVGRLVILDTLSSDHLQAIVRALPHLRIMCVELDAAAEMLCRGENQCSLQSATLKFFINTPADRINASILALASHTELQEVTLDFTTSISSLVSFAPLQQLRALKKLKVKVWDLTPLQIEQLTTAMASFRFTETLTRR